MASAPALSMFQPVALQIAPQVFRPFYPFAAVVPPHAPMHLDGWLHCQPSDAFNRWIKDRNIPELPSRRNPFVWIENVAPGLGVGQYTTDLRMGDLPPTTLREATHG